MGAAALALTLPGGTYLSLLTAAAAWPVRRSPPTPAGAARIVFLVPAHDESLGLNWALDTDILLKLTDLTNAATPS